MKFKINKGIISQRATKRFKWMVLSCLLLGTLNIAKDYGLSSLKLVDAGEDQTFEIDDIYESYVESALIQQKLMRD
jgi:hypothetical protein